MNKHEKEKYDEISTKSVEFSTNYMQHEGRYYVASIKQKYTYIYKTLEGEETSIMAEREVMTNHIKTENVVRIDSARCYPNSYYTNLFDYQKEYNSEFWDTCNYLFPTAEQEQIKQSLQLYDPIKKEYITE